MLPDCLLKEVISCKHHLYTGLVYIVSQVTFLVQCSPSTVVRCISAVNIIFTQSCGVLTNFHFLLSNVTNFVWLHCVILRCTILHCYTTVLHPVILCYVVLHFYVSVLHCVILRCTVLHCYTTVLHRVILRCVVCYCH